nr:hypothetical protein B11C_190075 [Bartonella sp. 1-1C]
MKNKCIIKRMKENKESLYKKILLKGKDILIMIVIKRDLLSWGKNQGIKIMIS